MAALDDFDDGAMDFGDADEAEAEAEAQGAASLAAALSGLTTDTAPAPATTPVVVAAAPPPPLADLVEAGAPEELVCPLTLQLLVDPVILTGDGITYSRAAIEEHLALCRDRKL